MGIIKEFKEFVSRGNVLDLAVGVIVGAAFTSIVDSLVKDVIMPVISLITGGIDFTSWKLVFGSGKNAATVNYGNFIAAVLNFFIVAAVIFLAVKLINRFHRTSRENIKPATKTCPYCRQEIDINATRCSYCTSDVDEN